MQKDGGEPQTQLLLNTECASTADCHDFRKFQLRPEFTKGTGNSVTAAFFDLFEDGRPDVLTVSDNQEDGFKMSAFTNTSQDSDAYFIKVVVLSGACYHNCRNKSSNYVPYGTNSGGLTV